MAIDEGEWHIVFGTPDGLQVDWVEVFERPHRFDGVPCGRAVILNGPSSVGKSTVMAALQQRSPFPWVVFDEPIVGLVDPGYLIWREQSRILHRGFIEGIAAVARAGNYIAASSLDVHDGWEYDLRFDTAATDIDTIVDQILALVDGPPLSEMTSRPRLSLVRGEGRRR